MAGESRVVRAALLQAKWTGDTASMIDVHEKYAREAAREILQAAQEKASSLGVQVQTRLVGSEHPDQAIIDAANEHGCDLVAMASHGRRGVNAVLLGSVTQKVLAGCALPVLVFRPAA